MEVVNTREGGRYVTSFVREGMAETLWISENGDSRLVGRYFPLTLEEIAKLHIGGA